MAGLKENGIKVKESDLGLLFEDLTRKILSKLGFEVAEDIRKSINTNKDKADIVVKISEKDIRRTLDLNNITAAVNQLLDSIFETTTLLILFPNKR